VDNLCTNYVLDESTERVTFNSQNTLLQNVPNVLHVTYKGFLSNTLKGWYRAKYKDTQNNMQHMFTTQMEPNFCRMFVPCIDEPARKTVFRLDVVTAHE